MAATRFEQFWKVMFHTHAHPTYIYTVPITMGNTFLTNKIKKKAHRIFTTTTMLSMSSCWACMYWKVHGNDMACAACLIRECNHWDCWIHEIMLSLTDFYEVCNPTGVNRLIWCILYRYCPLFLLVHFFL